MRSYVKPRRSLESLSSFSKKSQSFLVKIFAFLKIHTDIQIAILEMRYTSFSKPSFFCYLYSMLDFGGVSILIRTFAGGTVDGKTSSNTPFECWPFYIFVKISYFTTLFSIHSPPQKKQWPLLNLYKQFCWGWGCRWRWDAFLRCLWMVQMASVWAGVPLCRCLFCHRKRLSKPWQSQWMDWDLFWGVNTISCKSVFGKVKCYVFIVSSVTCIFVSLLYLCIITFT